MVKTYEKISCVSLTNYTEMLTFLTSCDAISKSSCGPCTSSGNALYIEGEATVEMEDSFILGTTGSLHQKFFLTWFQLSTSLSWENSILQAVLFVH